jgi:hypothetical protein
MPKIADNMEAVKLPTSNYGYTKVNKKKLQASEYTLVTLAVDESGSVFDFADNIERCVKEVVKGCRLAPRADNLLLRTVAFATRMREVHGFKLLQDVNESEFDSFYQAGGKARTGTTTLLFDTAENVVAAENNMAQDLTKDDYLVNGLFVVITDGLDNESTYLPKHVGERLKEAVGQEKMESLVSILVGVNLKDKSVETQLEHFKNEAGFTQFVAIEDASAKSLAKLAKFISKSITSQSNQVGTGQPSQPIQF